MRYQPKQLLPIAVPVLSAMLAILGQLYGVAEWGYGGVTVLLVVVLVHLRDHRELRAVVAGGAAGAESLAEKLDTAPLWSTPASSLADELAQELEALGELTQQSHAITELHTDPLRDPLYRELVVQERLRGRGDGDLFKRVLQYATRRLRSGAVVVALQESTGISLVGVGSPGERFERQLRGWLSPLLEGIRELPIGVQDGYQSADLFGGFCSHGFRYTVCARLRIRSADGTVQSGAIWAGYPENRAPLAAEVELIQALGTQLSLEIEYYRRAQALLQENRKQLAIAGKDSVLAQVSHDIRSPLGNVKAILSLLQFEQLRGESAELVQVALQNCAAAGDLVEDLMDLSRAEAGVLEGGASEQSAAELLTGIVGCYSAAAQLKAVGLVLLPVPAEILMRGSSSQLRRLFSNLVSNALKYTNQGQVTVSCEIDPEAESLQVVVQDSGVGMTAVQIEQLSVPFTRLHLGMAAGAGLGFTLAKLFAEKNGGRIEVSSSVGEGTTVRVSLPGRLVPQSSGAASTPKIANSPEIVIVDDDPSCVTTTGALLERLGYQVHRAGSVAEALRAVLTHPSVPCVLTDAEMPDGGAAALLEGLNQMHSTAAVVVLSGSADLVSWKLHPRVRAVVQKPFELSEISSALNGIYPYDSVSSLARRVSAVRYS